jgi:hypothetical protein
MRTARAPHHHLVPIAQPQPTLAQDEEERADDDAGAQRNAEEAAPRDGLRGARDIVGMRSVRARVAQFSPWRSGWAHRDVINIQNVESAVVCCKRFERVLPLLRPRQRRWHFAGNTCKDANVRASRQSCALGAARPLAHIRRLPTAAAGLRSTEGSCVGGSNGTTQF